MGWVKQETGVDLGSPQDWTENTSNALAETGEVVSDAIHDVGTAVAKDPLLSTAAVIALTPYIGAPAASALVSANAGAPPEVIARNMILAGVAAEVAQQVAPEVASMTNKTVGNIAGQAAGSATTAALTGRDPIQAATNALITGGITAGTSEVLGQVEGFSDLTPTQQRAVSAAVSAELQGKDPTAALIRGAINIGREKVQDEIKYAKYEDMDFGVNQGAVDKLAAEQAQNDFYESIGINPDTVKDTAPATTDVVDQLVNSGDEIASIGGQPVTTSPGEEPLADLSKSGVIMPDGSYKTWAELDELAGVPPGTTYTDGGTKITDDTFTKLSTTQKSTALDMVKSGIPMNQAVKYVNSMGQTVSQPTQQVQQTQQTSSGTALSPLSPQYLTSTANKQGFVNPLSTYQRMVASDTAPLQPNPAPTQDTVQVSQGNVMPDYYSYGQNQSIDDILGITAKEGGLVTPLMAKGGSVQKYAEGGLSVPMMNHGGKMRGDFRHGAHVAGPGDGQSDDIPAMLADGEYVLDSEIVAALGNGSTKAGSKLLDKFRQEIRAHKRSGSINSIPPKSKSPLQYLADAKKKIDKK
jgi:hypothetical protein